MLGQDSGFSNADFASLTVAMVALILAGLALLVGIQQWHLAQEQTSLTKKQAQIAEEQQAFVKAELARRADLGILLFQRKRDDRRNYSANTRKQLG